MPLAIAAAGCLLGYVEETQKSALPHLTGLAVENAGETIAMDASTRRNLEIDTHQSGNVENTLLGVLDETVTPMGARLLRRWLNRPLRDRQVLRGRHQAIGSLTGRMGATEHDFWILSSLFALPDIVPPASIRAAGDVCSPTGRLYRSTGSALNVAESLSSAAAWHRFRPPGCLYRMRTA